MTEKYKYLSKFIIKTILVFTGFGVSARCLDITIILLNYTVYWSNLLSLYTNFLCELSDVFLNLKSQLYYIFDKKKNHNSYHIIMKKIKTFFF